MNREDDAHDDQEPPDDESNPLAEFGDDESDDYETAPNTRKKHSIFVRTLRFFWRRRVFWQIRNTKEVIEVVLTAGILLATATQAYIYWKQTGIMRDALGQNERQLILSKGQLAVADRNARSAESGGKDTHDLAVQANTANGINRESLQSVQRALVTFSPAVNLLRVDNDPVTKSPAVWHFQIVLKNNGNTPTRNMIQHTNWRFLATPIPDNFSFPDLGPYGTPCAEGMPGCRPVPFVLGPKDSAGGTSLTMSKVTLETLVNGAAHIYIDGWAEYNDIFSGTKRHRSEICVEMVSADLPTNQFLYASCPQHNCTDEECSDWSGSKK